VAEDLLRDCHAALEEALRILGQATESKVLSGSPASALIREIERTGATLVAVGSHGRRRAAEIALGGTAGELLHTAPCSVLVAKTPGGRERFPRRIVAGIDGSLESDRALDVAQELATRLGAELRTVTAVGGKDVDLAHVHLRSPLAEEIDRHPVDALVAASRRADLLVVGSRGLHGLRALGSVSERVAHQAACSTLVVRPSADA
jgi:nucleotide-binding universal stress UspA family protein